MFIVLGVGCSSNPPLIVPVWSFKFFSALYFIRVTLQKLVYNPIIVARSIIRLCKPSSSCVAQSCGIGMGYFYIGISKKEAFASFFTMIIPFMKFPIIWTEMCVLCQCTCNQ